MANQYDTNLKLQAIADAIGDTSSSGLISALEDIADAVAGGGGGGTTVIANPSGTPTDTLNTIQIASTIYDIAGGGGGTGYMETTLWSGAPTTTSITLSDSVLNYDAIYVEGKFNNEAYMVETIDKATFTSYLGNDYISFGTHGAAYYGIAPASTATHFVFFGANYNGCTRVIGLKYASGGGGGSSALTKKSKEYSGISISANSYADFTDPSLAGNKALIGWALNGVATGNISVITAYIDEEGLLFRVKNNSGSSITTGILKIYYIELY